MLNTSQCVFERERLVRIGSLQNASHSQQFRKFFQTSRSHGSCWANWRLLEWMDALGHNFSHFETASLRKHCAAVRRWHKDIDIHSSNSCTSTAPSD
eukprot:9755445-Karenia_brevis.AAC.1